MSNYVESKSLVPVLKKSQFDNKATEFLQELWPAALEKPMFIPIMDIAKKKLGLRVFTKQRLSEDFSIYGQMCFTSGIVDLYDKENDEFREHKVRYGTMFVDPDTFYLRNLGCFNNTVAHEAVHWWKDRNYYIAASMVDNPKSIAFRCPGKEPDEHHQDKWTDEDWIEWQTNGIAARILMPKQTFGQQVRTIENNLVRKEGIHYPSTELIIRRTADFFHTSIQSTAIRMEELFVSA